MPRPISKKILRVVADIALAALATTLSVLDAAGGGIAYLLATLANAPLVARRRFPVAVLLTTTAALSGLYGSGYVSTTAFSES